MKTSRRNLHNTAALKAARLGGPPKLSRYAAKTRGEPVVTTAERLKARAEREAR